MGVHSDRRRELAEFLKSRRSNTSRAGLGLPEHGRGRTHGLRREEVSFLSGVSVSWYTWIEQAREISPSRQVLDAIAATLRLSLRERAYILELAGFSAADLDSVDPVRDAPPPVRRLLDALAAYPAYAIAPDWGISAWNTAYESLYPNVAKVSPTQRNLLWLVFTDPHVRELLPDWETDSRHFLAQFRAETGHRLGEAPFSQLVRRLLDSSEHFRTWWDSHDIEPFTSRERSFYHPVVGTLKLEHHRLAPSDHPDLHVVVYTPVDLDTAQRLEKLTSS